MKIPSSKSIAGTFGIEELTDLDKRTLHMVLATSHDDRPYTSLISYAFDETERTFIFLTPRKTKKFVNIKANPNVALLVNTSENTSKDYLGGAAYTIIGKANPVRRGARHQRLLSVFLKKHMKLAQFSHADGIALISVGIESCSRVSRFQEVHIFKDAAINPEASSR